MLAALTTALAFSAKATVAAAQPVRYLISSVDWTPCQPPSGVHYVYFNADVLTDPARGYDPNQFRAAVIRAIAVWNEESLSGQRMVFMGDGDHVLDTNVIVIHHPATRTCTSPETGAGFTEGASSGGSCAQGRTIRMHWENCESPRGEIRYSAGMPSVAEYSYEAMMIHELGHAAFGFPEQLSVSEGVMTYCNADYRITHQCPGVPTGPVGERLHLHRIDQETAIYHFGGTPSTERTRAIDATNAWLGSENLVFPATSFGPSLTTRRASDPAGSVFVGSTNWSQTFAFRAGSAGSWTAHAPIVPPSVSSGTGVRPWVSFARSDYDELAVAWPDCTELSNCKVHTAWRSSSGSWVVAAYPIDLPVAARVEIAYDPDLDYFVLFAIHPDGRLFYAYELAYQSNNWSTPAPLDGYNGYNSDRFFRFMGGAVFYRHPGQARGTLHGSLFAASATPDGGASTPIMGFDIGYDSVSNHYYTSGQFFAGPWGQQAAFNTIRNFSVRRELNSNVLVAAWVDDQSTNRIRVARTPDMSFGYFGSPTVMTSGSTAPIQSSVSLGNLIDSSTQFVLGWSSP